MEDLFKKRFPEDVVQYCIYLSCGVNNELSSKDVLEEYLKKCLGFVLKETRNYIWHNDCFNLHTVIENNLHYLHGSTNFADSIDDEWFIVYLLKQLTKEYPELVASVMDIDGQFLLIEAAEHIPKWLTPDTCENRVFFSAGSLHVLQKPTSPGQISFSPVISPTVQEAVSLISSFPLETLASPNIMNCIESRICDFPRRAFNNIHMVNAYIPRKLVHILDESPNFISNCVQAFYLRDPIDLRACRTFKRMLPDDRVWCQIPMTRLHYAQLMQQEFSPDKRSGYQIRSDLTAVEHKGVDLGMKIAHGCEIFLRKNMSNIHCDDHSYFDEQNFLHFIESLKEMDYFGEELEGSKLFQQLFSQAKLFYLSNSGKNDEKNMSAYNIPSNIHEILDPLRDIGECDRNAFPVLQKLEIRSCINDLSPESCDEWMYLDEDDVNRLADKMNKGFSSFQKNSDSSQNAQFDEESQQFKETAEKVKSFVKNKSDFTGVEIEKDASSIKFNTSEFLSSLERLLQIDHPQEKKSFSNIHDEESDEFLSSDDEQSSDSLNEDDKEFHDYLKSMDSELSKTEVGKSFVSKHTNGDSDFSQLDNDTRSKVNADVNLLENFMMGRDEEKIASGPISNILNSIGVELPD